MADTNKIWLAGEKLAGAFYDFADEAYEYVKGARTAHEQHDRAVEVFENDGQVPQAAQPDPTPTPEGLPPTGTPATSVPGPGEHFNAPPTTPPATQ